MQVTNQCRYHKSLVTHFERLSHADLQFIILVPLAFRFRLLIPNHPLLGRTGNSRPAPRFCHKAYTLEERVVGRNQEPQARV